MAKKTVRILRQLPVDGVLYRPDQLVSFEKEAADQYVEAGAADDGKGGIAYCKGEGAEVVTHAVPEEVQAERDAEAKAAEEKAAQEAADAEAADLAGDGTNTGGAAD